MAVINFDANTVAPSTGTQDAIPAGWYNTMIESSELKPTKDATGQYLELKFNVLDGQYAGRKLFSRLNLQNNSPVAQEIAYRDLSAICHAVGVLQVGDSAVLHNRPLKVKVKYRAASGEYEASNEISAYKNINEVVDTPAAAVVGFQAPAAQQFQAPAAPAQNTPPNWQQAPAPVAPVQQAPAPVAQPWTQAPVQQAPAQQFQAPAPAWILPQQ